MRAKDPQVVQIERNFLRWYYSRLEVSRSGDDDVAEIERMRGIINSFGHYPEYPYFCRTFNAAPRLFPRIFSDRSIDAVRKIYFCENTFDFFKRDQSRLLLIRATVCHLLFIITNFFNLFDIVIPLGWCVLKKLYARHIFAILSHRTSSHCKYEI